MRVSYVSNAAHLSVITSRRVRNILPAIRRSEQETGRIMRATSQRLSLGTISSVELALLGHPYSRRNPRPPQDPGIINRQTGAFAASWHYRTEISGSRTLLYIYNSASYARYMLGTRYMIRRPILALMASTEGPARLARLRAAFTNVYRNL